MYINDALGLILWDYKSYLFKFLNLARSTQRNKTTEISRFLDQDILGSYLRIENKNNSIVIYTGHHGQKTTPNEEK